MILSRPDDFDVFSFLIHKSISWALMGEFKYSLLSFGSIKGISISSDSSYPVFEILIKFSYIRLFKIILVFQSI